MGKKIEGWAGTAGANVWKKVRVLLRKTRFWRAVPVYLIHSAATRAVRKPPLLCIVIGVGRISKMLPLSLRASSAPTNGDIYTFASVALLYLLNRLTPSTSRDDPSDNDHSARYILDGL